MKANKLPLILMASCQYFGLLLNCRLLLCYTDSLTKEKKDLQTEIKSVEESLSTAGEELKDMKKQLTSLEEEVELARKQRDEVQSR